MNFGPIDDLEGYFWGYFQKCEIQAAENKFVAVRLESPSRGGRSCRQEDVAACAGWITEIEPGRVRVEVRGPQVSAAVENVLIAAAPVAAKPEVQRRIAEHRAAFAEKLSPSQRGERFAVPRLCVEYQGKLSLVDEELVIEAVDWNLLEYPADLSRFDYNDASKTFELDIEGSKVVIRDKDAEQLDLNLLPAYQTDVDLVAWLSKQLRQLDVTYQTLTAWTLEAVTDLLRRPKMQLATLVRAKFILARKLAELIAQARSTAYRSGWNRLLFGSDANVKATEEFAFHFQPYYYPAVSYYSGPWKFEKHFYPIPGELKSDGEEFDCAVAINRSSAVKVWVRNLAKQPTTSFWLQTSTDRFYPDFVAQLHDGRVMVVEYKGGYLADGGDAEEKRKLGELWAARSGGKALFLMAEKHKDGMTVAEQIAAAVAAS